MKRKSIMRRAASGKGCGKTCGATCKPYALYDRRGWPSLERFYTGTFHLTQHCEEAGFAVETHPKREERDDGEEAKGVAHQ